MSRSAAATSPAHGSGSARPASSRRPAAPNRSATGQGWPKASSVAWIRFFSAVRWRTRCSRQRARSRSARTAGSGSQIAGTRSRRDSSASTQASIRSVLAASGASPLTKPRVGDLHVPAAQLELVVHEAGAGHRLDRRRHRLAELPDPGDQRGQPAAVRRRGGYQHRRARLIHDMHIHTRPAQVQPDVQHEHRASFHRACRLSPQA
jgi:hypothetical protein